MTAEPLATVGSALAIPDPRQHPVPAGWFEQVAAPAILDASDWATLDEYEARLRAFASYIDSFNGDAVEFEKALRIVEKRRGDLLGDPMPGSRTDLSPVTRALEVAESPMTVSRWRTIAAHWDELWPLVRDATEKREVTQAALLRLVESPAGRPRPKNKHVELMKRASAFAQLEGRWDVAMTETLSPPQAQKQLTVLHKAARLLSEAIEAVEYRAATTHTFMGR